MSLIPGMGGGPSIGLALIAKNEANRLPNLLASCSGAFDQVVLVDTGSTDDTREVFRDWTEQQAALNPNFSYLIDHFEWTKDFGAARRYAQGLLRTDWEVWADCDDIITGAQNLRAVAAQASPAVVAFICGYNYGQHPETGACICYLKRERLVRRGHGRWVNRVHEAQVVEGGQVQPLGPEVAEWVHQKQYSTVEDMQRADAKRNLDILHAWNKDEPNNSRTLAYLGTETMVRGEYETATDYFEQYLALEPEWDEERAQVHRKLAVCYLVQEKPDAAIASAQAAMLVHPQWADSHLTLAEAYYVKAEYQKCIYWAGEVMRLGQPDTLLIINPLDYTCQPRKLLAGAYGALEQWDAAIKHGTTALGMNPGDIAMQQRVAAWRGAAKREHTANSIALMAQQLITHDEQLKALKLLEECVPHFAVDHPGIVGLRSSLRERLAWLDDPRSLLDHYENGGSKPEDFLPEDKLDEVPASLPRTQFLYRGIHEQLLERARWEHDEKQITAAMEILCVSSEEQITAAKEALRVSSS